MIYRHTIEELIKRAGNANPPPCDPDVCGITGVPCPRCQKEHLTAWILAQRLAESQRLRPRKRKRR